MITQTKKLVTQASAAMTRKQFWSTIAGSGSVILMWALESLGEVIVPADVAAAITGIAMALVGYLVRDRAG